MLHTTKGIVLRSVKYGETSVIVLIFTEKFGAQSYLVNGVRSAAKKGSGKANHFQPSAILDMVVYHHEAKSLQRVKEFKWNHLYHHVFSNVPKNAVALFMVELITKCLKQPEANTDLFHFCEDAFIHLDESNGSVTANFPLFFALHFTSFFGLRPTNHTKNVFSETDNLILDLKEGQFTDSIPGHPYFIDGKLAEVTNELLKVMQPEELEELKLNHDFRRRLLTAFEMYYALHIQDFGKMKTLPVLEELLS